MPWPAFGFPTPTHLPARPLAVGWRRRGQAGGVVLGVLIAHGWLIGPVQQPMGRVPAHVPAIQLVTLPPAEAPQPAPAVTPAEAAPPAPPPAEKVPEPPPPAPPPEPVVELAAPPPPPPDAPIDWAAGPPPPDPVAGSQLAPDGTSPSSLGAPVPGTVAGQQEVNGGRPPIYTTQRPEQSFKLDYRIERGDDAGTGQLSYDLRTGGIFIVRFSGEVNGKALQDHVSRGFFNAGGFAPQRMIERQRGVEVRAINFQREEGVITFSSSTRAIALYPGAQDRTSVLLQLVAIAQAQPGGLRSGQHIRMQVAGVRGTSDEWDFEVIGDEVVQPAGAPIPVVHLKREPVAPYDQRVELWLAREAGHLPVGLRFTTVPGRNSEAYWLNSPLPAPPPPASAPGSGTP